MQRDAVTVIAHPLVRPASTAISMQRPIVAAQLVAIVVRTIDPAIATLVSRYAITALAHPFLARAWRLLSFSFVVKYVSLYCIFAESFGVAWRLNQKSLRLVRLLLLALNYLVKFKIELADFSRFQLSNCVIVCYSRYNIYVCWLVLLNLIDLPQLCSSDPSLHSGIPLQMEDCGTHLLSETHINWLAVHWPGSDGPNEPTEINM